MSMKSLSDLQTPDDRTLHFSPLGLGGRMRPEDAAEFQQRVVARHELVPAVAEGTRQSFDQLREIFAYGLLCSDIFTVINDRALLVLEQALRDRFIDFHRGTVTLVNRRTGETEEVVAERYEQVHDFISGHRGWELRLGAGPRTMRFNGTLGGLRVWAREMGFLRGQRNRHVEDAIARLRNYVAHPSSFHLTTPVDAANTISDLAEIINHLWGASTPGGRMYPAPVRRTIVHISWNEETGEVMSGLAALSPNSPDQGTPGDPEGVTVAAVEEAEDGWTLILVRGMVDDWDLLHFDARFDTGRCPAEWLWGLGSPRDAMSWLAGHQPPDDEVDVLDRVFLLRYQDPILEVPRNPDQAASVSDDEKPGTWYVIRADSPEQAFNHQRQTLAGGFDCADHGTCPRCPVQTLGTGTWQEAMYVLTAHGIRTRTQRVPDIRVPSRMGWPRCNRILGNGTWDIPPGEH